jgi:hypothetical protein
MHDIGGLLWIVLVIVGVVTSIVQSSRRSVSQRTVSRYQQAVPQPQRAATPPQPAPEIRPEVIAELENIIRQSQQAPVRVPTPPSPAKPPPVPVPSPPAAPPPRPMPSTPRRPAGAQKLFGDHSSLVRAVIAAEVLGKPLALRNEYPRY